ncbi:putative E3 ubiquitin-protein ligase HERC4 [Glycine max]|nr:putative E3 ubiquitin-protein ligase HERC4 [Glycine max]
MVSSMMTCSHVLYKNSKGKICIYTWGKGYCGALGHRDEIEKTTPELLTSLKNQLVVQVCARKRKTFVLSMALAPWDLAALDSWIEGILDTLRAHHVSQISTGLYHTVVITSRGQIFGFGDNERAQLGHDTLRSCLEPTQIFIKDTSEDVEST